MQEHSGRDPQVTDGLELGITAIANLRTSLTFTLECLDRSTVHVPELKSAIEDVLSLASRQELEARVLQNIKCARLRSDAHAGSAAMIAAPYKALSDMHEPGRSATQQHCLHQRV